MTRKHVWLMLGALTGASFFISTAGLSLSPFLRVIAQDLQTNLAAVANLLAFTSIAWGISSLIAGMASDRYGRRPILVAAVLLMGGAQLGVALAQNYVSAIVWMTVAGVSGGAYTGTVYATVSDHIASQQRARALGWVVTGQSLSMVFGVPLLALLGAFGGWRGAFMMYAAITVITALFVRLAVPKDRQHKNNTTTDSSASNKPIQALRRPDILLLLGAGITERVCFAVVAVYIATYLQTSYAIALDQLALALSLIALGTVSGNMLGASLADRFSARILIYAGSAFFTALLVLPLLLWQAGLLISLVLGFAYTFSNSLGRPALLASLSEVPSEVRGAVLGMNVTTASIGWLTAAALGGWLVTTFGFYALAILCALAALSGCVLGLSHWRLQRS